MKEFVYDKQAADELGRLCASWPKLEAKRKESWNWVMANCDARREQAVHDAELADKRVRRCEKAIDRADAKLRASYA